MSKYCSILFDKNSNSVTVMHANGCKFLLDTFCLVNVPSWFATAVKSSSLLFQMFVSNIVFGSSFFFNQIWGYQ